MPSFDVVSRTDLNEVDNAINGIRREIQQRFDLKGSMCSVERSGDTITVIADNDMLLRQLHDLLHSYCVRRGVDSGALKFAPSEDATKGSLRQQVTIRQGIEQELGRQIIKAVKGAKIKVQVSIQGNELRATGKKRDDLQEAIALIKEMKVDLPLQYVNFRD